MCSAMAHSGGLFSRASVSEYLIFRPVLFRRMQMGMYEIYLFALRDTINASV